MFPKACSVHVHFNRGTLSCLEPNVLTEEGEGHQYAGSKYPGKLLNLQLEQTFIWGINRAVATGVFDRDV